METKTVVCIKVYDEEGEYLKIEPSLYASGKIVLSGKWNSVNLIFSPEYAKRVANALLDCVDDVESQYD